ncbi:MAG TPA: hypothetical protein VFS94_12395 [Gemmatimonadales bacterium]|nr:hypothetical protein [Gemmatimonadales bacterium]
MCRECEDNDPVEWTVESFTDEVEAILSSEYGPVRHRAPIDSAAAEMAIQAGEDPFDFAVDFAAEHDMVRRRDWGPEDNQKLLADMGMRWDGERMVDIQGEELGDHCPTCEAMGLHWEGNGQAGGGFQWYDDDEEPAELTELRMEGRSGDGGQGA